MSDTSDARRIRSQAFDVAIGSKAELYAAKATISSCTREIAQLKATNTKLVLRIRRIVILAALLATIATVALARLCGWIPFGW